MSDILRTSKHFPSFLESVSLYLIEASPSLRSIQAKTLHCHSLTDRSLLNPNPSPSPSLSMPTSDASLNISDWETISRRDEEGETESKYNSIFTSRSETYGIPVEWHTSLSSVSLSSPTIFLGHEFLDALPINRFYFSKERGWLEVLVDAHPQNKGEFRFVLSPRPTPLAMVLKPYLPHYRDCHEVGGSH